MARDPFECMPVDVGDVVLGNPRGADTRWGVQIGKVVGGKMHDLLLDTEQGHRIAVNRYRARRLVETVEAMVRGYHVPPGVRRHLEADARERRRSSDGGWGLD